MHDSHFSCFYRLLLYRLRILQESHGYVHTFPIVYPVCLNIYLPVVVKWLTPDLFRVLKSSVYFRTKSQTSSTVLSASVFFGLICVVLSVSSACLGLHYQRTFLYLHPQHSSLCYYMLSLLLPVLVLHFFLVGIHMNILWNQLQIPVLWLSLLPFVQSGLLLSVSQVVFHFHLVLVSSLFSLEMGYTFPLSVLFWVLLDTSRFPSFLYLLFWYHQLHWNLYWLLLFSMLQSAHRPDIPYHITHGIFVFGISWLLDIVCFEVVVLFLWSY